MVNKSCLLIHGVEVTAQCVTCHFLFIVVVLSFLLNVTWFLVMLMDLQMIVILQMCFAVIFLVFALIHMLQVSLSYSSLTDCVLLLLQRSFTLKFFEVVDIERSLNMLKNGRSPGIDGLSKEHFTFCHHLYYFILSFY